MLSKIEEIKLIARCVTFDDHRAFARLVEEYSPGLRRFVYNLTLGDAALTDDITQETFIKAYTQLRSFQGLARFGTWLYTIACRVHQDYLRKHSREIIDSELCQHNESVSTPLDSVDCKHDIDIALSGLSNDERTAVLLFYLEDRPIKEISRITGKPEGTIKAHLSRAKVKMAKNMKEYKL